MKYILNFIQILSHNIHANGLKSLFYSFGLSGSRYIEYIQALEYVENEKVNNILDVGSGHSLLPSIFIKKGYSVISIDLNKNSVRWQKSKNNSNNFIPIIASSTNLPFKNNQFSAITSISVLEHIKDDGDIKSIKEISRILKLGGFAVVSVPISTLEKTVYERFFGIPTLYYKILGQNIMGKILEKFNVDRSTSYYERFYSCNNIIKRFQNKNFYIERSEKYWDWSRTKILFQIIPKGSITFLELILGKIFLYVSFQRKSEKLNEKEEIEFPDIGTCIMQFRKK